MSFVNPMSIEVDDPNVWSPDSYKLIGLQCRDGSLKFRARYEYLTAIKQAAFEEFPNAELLEKGKGHNM